MSSLTTKSFIDRERRSLINLEKTLHGHESKKLVADKRITQLRQQLNRASSANTISSYQRQIQTKQTELNRINKSITDARKKVFDKQAQINKLNDKLARELKSEQAKVDALIKKQRHENTKFAKEQEKGLDRQIRQQKTLSKAIVNRSNSFSDHVAAMGWKPTAHENSEYEINEVVQINGRIDEVLAKLNEIGLGQSILFDEIEELKDKSKKISRKDLRLLTIGKLVSFGTKEISPSQADDFFKLITGVDIDKLIG
ncbi:hypothetical protein [Neolewinella agarilytica]|uniref:hypothetical protein n=1 Tax=Neolewinella agarilytica TaxID=478744 RepID=UPI00235786DD|nr:hypothetical protein [Neolewinella agarilytica]